ncbi:MAG: glycine oxidase ThiO [Planctomycetota bacterium]|jgi:glycine oxidase
MSAVVIVGGGAIGLSIAWEVARRGADVTVLEQGRVGREASWAGAGFFPPGHLAGAKTPHDQLRAFSHSLWSDWTARLVEQTGVDNGYRVCGGITISFDQPLDSLVDEWQDEGVSVERLAPGAARELEPALSDQIVDAFYLPQLAQARNPRHLKAVRAACEAAGVRFQEGCPVTGWERTGETFTAARTTAGDIHGDQFVIAAGAWSSMLLADAGCPVTIEPVRGQIALLQLPRPIFRRVIEDGPRYLVPRPDGRVLIGSTEERVGFVKQNTVAGVTGLLEFATSLVPELASADVERCWSGLRPCPTRELPLIGRLPDSETTFVATGHFRSGLQMSPGTAVLVSELLTGETTSIDLTPFDPVNDNILV